MKTGRKPKFENESDEYKRGYATGYTLGYVNAVKRIKPSEKMIKDLNSIKVTNDGQYFEADDFVCSNCGIHIEDWVGRDEENCAYEYVFRFCPNCGAFIEQR